MGQHWAMAIGIDHYRLLQSLKCAQRDAEALRAWLIEEGGLAPDQIILLTDTSPIQWQQPSYPDGETIQQWLMHLQRDLIQPGDSLWLFFSGYGDSWKNEDYLLPIDANPAAPTESWIALRSVYGLLKTLPSDRIAVFLDINRSQSVRGQQPLGHHAIALAKEFGIPTFLSCLPEQFSHESAAIGQGLFTAALLESLRRSHNLAEVARHLRIRLPELSQHSQRPLQDPIIIATADPLERWTVPIAPSPQISRVSPPASASLPTLAPHLPPRSRSRLKPILGLLGILFLAIMLTSLLRTCQTPLSSPSSTPSSTPLPSNLPASSLDPIRTTTSTPLQVPIAPNGSAESILEDARRQIKPTRASEVVNAIERARQIPPGDPQYRAAQRQIDLWSQDIYTLAKQRANQGDFKGAIAAAQLVPDDRKSLHQQAQKSIVQWKKRLR